MSGLRRAAADLLLVALEATWLSAWLGWLAGLGGLPAPGAALLLASGALAWLLARGLLALGAADALARALVGVGGLLALLLALRLPSYRDALGPNGLSSLRGFLLEGSPGPGGGAVLLLAGAVLLPWWRGARRATEYPSPARARRATGVALAALALLAALSALLRGASVPALSGGAIASGAILSLAGLAAARLQLARAQGGSPAPGFGRTWASVLTLAVAAVLASAFGAAALLAGLRAARLGDPDWPARARDALFGGLLALLGWITAGLSWLAAGFWGLVRGLLPGEGGQAPMPRLPPPEPLPEAVGAGASWPWLGPVLRGGLLALLALLVALWLLRALRRRAENAAREELASARRSHLSLARLGGDARALASAARDAVARRLEALRDGGVRSLYRRLLREMERAGSPRPPTATPAEFAPRVTERAPEASQDVGALTQAYIAARYGAVEPAAGALASLRAAWRRVREQLAG